MTRRVAPPNAAEVRMTRALRRILVRFERQVRRSLLSTIRQDALTPRQRLAMAELRDTLADIDSVELRRVGEAVWEHNSTELGRLLSINVGDLGLEEFLESFVRENTTLIRSVMARQLVRMERIIVEAATEGTSNRVLAQSLMRTFRLSRAQANTIARTEIAKANSQLTQMRMMQAGVGRYRWSTSRDERVRDRHSELDGQIFEWTAPPIAEASGARYHPGQGINCRCVAIPVLE